MNISKHNTKSLFQEKGIIVKKIIAFLFVCIGSLLIILYYQRTKQSAWMTYVQQTMASQNNVRLEAQDKFGISVIFEIVKAEGGIIKGEEINKKLSHIYGHAFAPLMTQFLKTHPAIAFSTEPNFFNQFKVLVENNNWKLIEKKIQDYTTQHFKDDMMRPKTRALWYLIAKNKETDTPIGFFQFSVSSDDPFGSIYITKLSVKPEMQHRGLGKLMMSTVLKLLPQTTRLYLDTLTSATQAKAAYYSYGFVEYHPQKINTHSIYDQYSIYLEYKTTQSNILQIAAQKISIVTIHKNE